MKIVIYCHAEPVFRPAGLLTAEEFENIYKREEESGIRPVPEYAKMPTERQIRVSSSALSRETARQLFGREDWIADKRLDGIRETAFCRRPVRLPAFLWRAAASAERIFCPGGQPESRKEAKDRAASLLDDLEKDNRDCILISHRNFIPLLLDEIRKRKYEYRRSGSFGISYLEKTAAAPSAAHCGGCGHNCLLSRPGCYVGEDAARMQKKKNSIFKRR